MTIKRLISFITSTFVIGLLTYNASADAVRSVSEIPMAGGQLSVRTTYRSLLVIITLVLVIVLGSPRKKKNK